MPILNWLNKDEAVKATQQMPYRLLETVPELIFDDADAGNRPPIHIKSHEILHSGEDA
ncbi:MAG: hypothetical protein Q9M16_01175 [Mariprofundus sp.]|nr:hypothetical protein [Mariprofundus sp.]